MIRKNSLNILVLIFIFILIPLSGQARARNYSSADRQTFFNDVTDSIATLGMSPQEAKKIKRERRDIRRSIRLEKARAHKNAKIQKNIKKQQKEMLDKIKAEKEVKDHQRVKRNKRIENLKTEKPIPDPAESPGSGRTESTESYY